MKLYSFPGSCGLAAHIVLEWTGQPYALELMDKADLASPAFRALNPNGAVPVLEHEGWVLFENAAILNYLADLHPESGLLGDGSPRGRAEVERWLAMINSDVHPTYKPLFGGTSYLDAAGFEQTQDHARQRLRHYFEHLNSQLDGREWLTGQRSIADPYLFVTLMWAGLVGVDLQGLEHLAAFSQRMRADESVQKALTGQGLPLD